MKGWLLSAIVCRLFVLVIRTYSSRSTDATIDWTRHRVSNPTIRLVENHEPKNSESRAKKKLCGEKSVQHNKRSFIHPFSTELIFCPLVFCKTEWFCFTPINIEIHTLDQEIT